MYIETQLKNSGPLYVLTTTKSFITALLNAFAYVLVSRGIL